MTFMKVLSILLLYAIIVMAGIWLKIIKVDFLFVRDAVAAIIILLLNYQLLRTLNPCMQTIVNRLTLLILRSSTIGGIIKRLANFIGTIKERATSTKESPNGVVVNPRLNTPISTNSSKPTMQQSKMESFLKTPVTPLQKIKLEAFSDI